MLPAEFSNLPIPAAVCEAPVLNCHRFDVGFFDKHCQLVRIDVAYSDAARSSRSVNFLDCAPYLPIIFSETGIGIGTVQQIGIDVIRSQVSKGGLKRLAHLSRKRSLGAVRHAVILSIERRELRLDKH